MPTPLLVHRLTEETILHKSEEGRTAARALGSIIDSLLTGTTTRARVEQDVVDAVVKLITAVEANIEKPSITCNGCGDNLGPSDDAYCRDCGKKSECETCGSDEPTVCEDCSNKQADDAREGEREAANEVNGCRRCEKKATLCDSCAAEEHA